MGFQHLCPYPLPWTHQQVSNHILQERVTWSGRNRTLYRSGHFHSVVIWGNAIVQRKSLTHCVEASPVNKKLSAYQLKEEEGGGSSSRERGFWDRVWCGKRFTPNVDGDSHMKLRREKKPATWYLQSRINGLINDELAREQAQAQGLGIWFVILENKEVGLKSLWLEGNIHPIEQQAALNLWVITL